MGYNVSIENGTLRIPVMYLDRVYDAMCELNNLPSDLKNGGAYQGGEQQASWFSWMPPNFPEVYDNAQQVLEGLGFLDLFQEGDDLIVHSYDSKRGQEVLFIAAIAPWITPDSALYWLGEDGDRWRWTFQGGILEEHSGRVVYDEYPTIHLP